MAVRFIFLRDWAQALLKRKPKTGRILFFRGQELRSKGADGVEVVHGGGGSVSGIEDVPGLSEALTGLQTTAGQAATAAAQAVAAAAAANQSLASFIEYSNRLFPDEIPPVYDLALDFVDNQVQVSWQSSSPSWASLPVLYDVRWKNSSQTQWDEVKGLASTSTSLSPMGGFAYEIQVRKRVADFLLSPWVGATILVP